MPLITVSRMVGAGGAELAARVAAVLGWQLVDNELVDSVAQRLGVPVAEVVEREERVPTLTQRLADAFDARRAGGVSRAQADDAAAE